MNNKKEKEVKYGGFTLSLFSSIVLVVLVIQNLGNGTPLPASMEGYAILGILDILGVISFLRPSIGEYILEALSRIGRSQEGSGNTSVKQTQKRSGNGPQIQAGRDVYFNTKPEPEEVGK